MMPEPQKTTEGKNRNATYAATRPSGSNIEMFLVNRQAHKNAANENHSDAAQ